jgi:hypothetical protein
LRALGAKRKCGFGIGAFVGSNNRDGMDVYANPTAQSAKA